MHLKIEWQNLILCFFSVQTDLNKTVHNWFLIMLVLIKDNASTGILVRIAMLFSTRATALIDAQCVFSVLTFMLLLDCQRLKQSLEAMLSVVATGFTYSTMFLSV